MSQPLLILCQSEKTRLYCSKKNTTFQWHFDNKVYVLQKVPYSLGISPKQLFSMWQLRISGCFNLVALTSQHNASGPLCRGGEHGGVCSRNSMCQPRSDNSHFCWYPSCHKLNLKKETVLLLVPRRRCEQDMSKCL